MSRARVSLPDVTDERAVEVAFECAANGGVSPRRDGHPETQLAASRLSQKVHFLHAFRWKINVRKARFIFERVEGALPKPARVVRVTVGEDESLSATWSQE